MNFRSIFLFQSLVFTAISQLRSTSEITVKSRFGYVEGYRAETKDCHLVDFFWGVPFANKPQRFTRSTVVNNWEGIHKATSLPPKCIPFNRPENSSEYSEDCLYLNIMTPANRKNSTLLPVVVFIHGGGFQNGDGNDANCESFANNFVSQNIVVVTIQYRLGAFGFLTMGCDSEIIPCNIGLWDQITAFEFLNRTIDSFGGDHRNMTLMGHSAGSISASIHSISPISSNYFKNFIQLSGSSWGIDKFKKSNLEQSEQIVNGLGCKITTREEFLNCANNKTLDEYYSVQVNTNLRPHIGDKLLPDSPSNLTDHSENKNLFIGLQTLEGLYFTYLKSSPLIFPYINRSVVEEYINSTIAVQYGIDSGNAFRAACAYFLGSSETSNYSYYMRQHTKILSNLLFDIAVLREIRDKLKFSKNSIYVYHFQYFNDAEFDSGFPVKATYHCQEFPYLWNDYKDNYFDFDSDDRIVSRFLLSSIGNFVITGNPSTTNFSWPNTDTDLQHVIIQPRPAIDTELFQKDYDFWDEMRKEFKYDLITGMHYYNTDSASALSLIFSFAVFIRYTF